MTADPAALRAVLTDIEGTTSSLSFVKEVLFPYARARLPEFIAAHAGDPAVRRELDEVARSEGRALSDGEAVEVLRRWMDEDRKATPLKALQGMIWRAGYAGGAYRAHVYDDAVARLRRWHARGVPLYVYSSGSVAAQRLFFGHTTVGDLTPLFAGHFDTTTGPKTEPASYRAIAREVGMPAAQILFLSDVTAELDAARTAGMATRLVARDEPPPAGSDHPVVRTFDEIEAP